MEKTLKIVVIIIVVGIVVGLSALLWPRPCTPDKDCVDYNKINNTVNSNVNNVP